jgi:hypothetical protein
MAGATPTIIPCLQHSEIEKPQEPDSSRGWALVRWSSSIGPFPRSFRFLFIR